MSESMNIGYITEGGLKEGFTARLTVSPEFVQEGSFVVAENGTRRFYGLVTDLKLRAADPRFQDRRALDRVPDAIRKQFADRVLYTEMDILPAMMQDVGKDPADEDYRGLTGGEDNNPIPVKMVPPHFSPVRLGDAADVASVFGKIDKKENMAIGTTREQGHPVALNLEKLVQRSSGIFGSTGTGKSFLTRMILAGLIQKGIASTLVFDMHNEYAYGAKSEGKNNTEVPGLKNKMPGRVKVCTLGTGGSINGKRSDFDLVIGHKDVTTEDILMLSQTLNLRDTTATTLSVLIKSFGRDWFHQFMELGPSGSDTVENWAQTNGVNESAATALQNKLRRLYDKKYLQTESSDSAVNAIVNALENGISVIVSFDKYQSDLDYLFVANILTRKVREAWIKKSEAHLADKTKNPEPIPLVVAIEEAHKLLSREMASQTSFSVIAREMRKYSVTLLVIDQRPSQIDDEIMSQLGTRVSGWLGDEDDIKAVLSGLSGRDALRGMLARLQQKQEVLLLGYGVPMPLPIRSRLYDNEFWKDLLGENRDEVIVPSKKDDFLTNF